MMNQEFNQALLQMLSLVNDEITKHAFLSEYTEWRHKSHCTWGRTGSDLKIHSYAFILQQEATHYFSCSSVLLGLSKSQFLWPSIHIHEGLTYSFIRTHFFCDFSKCLKLYRWASDGALSGARWQQTFLRPFVPFSEVAFHNSFNLAALIYLTGIPYQVWR